MLFVVSLGVGPVWLPPATVVGALVGQGDEAARIIVGKSACRGRCSADDRWDARPFRRGAAGAAPQSLAAPSLFGAPSAAAFGAVAVISLGIVDALSFALPAAAIAGALLSVALLLLVAGPRASLLVLILAGLAVSSLAGRARRWRSTSRRTRSPRWRSPSGCSGRWKTAACATC